MAVKAKSMSQIKQLIQLHQNGKSIKFIARSLGISKNTVKAYLAKIASSKIDVQALLKLDDPILEGEFHAGNPAYKDARYDHFISKLDYFAKGCIARASLKCYFGKNTGKIIRKDMGIPSSLFI